MTHIPIYKPTRLDKIADIPYYTEGPVTDKKGNCFFTTLKGEVIYKIDSKGLITAWAKTACPNGQFILPEGDHLVCDSEIRAVIRYTKDGSFIRNEVDAADIDLEVDTPNDVVADAAGNIYFTDSIRYRGKVYRLGHKGRLSVVADGLDYPNGLVFSEDGKWLYVAESYENRILKIRIGNTGQTYDDIDVFAILPNNPSGKMKDNLPDGLALDRNGHLWVAHYGMGAVYKIDANGSILFSVSLPMPLVSNLAFIENTTLLVTGGYNEPGPGAVFKITL